MRPAHKVRKTATVTPEGANGYLRVTKPDSGPVVGSTVSAGIGSGMLLAVYLDEPTVFDEFFAHATQISVLGV